MIRNDVLHVHAWRVRRNDPTMLGYVAGGAGSRLVANGVLRCGFHVHTVHTVHDDSWDIAVADDGVPEFIPPPHTPAPRRNHRHD